MPEVYTREYVPEPHGVTGSPHQPPATHPQPPTPLLDFHNISVTRGVTTVLHNITLRIQAGEHAAILGPNGCGKSTLIKTITRECFQEYGRIAAKPFTTSNCRGTAIRSLALQK
ncbi:MAG TPA: ATP-binding cassette domain-containing protein [Bryobacteraceae bacterium]|jgi:ABC-type molybdenum transport system ATPase subunit/photorepair protein PhrA|nr:ATP-binding cassette domain-containing protein [Bryobacteraceae bacterium]